jgi:putative ABC transport system permease protein
LLTGAGLSIRSFQSLRHIDPAFDANGVVTMQVSLEGSPENESGRRAAFYSDLIDRVQRIPGVRSASAINHIPIGGDIWGFPFHVEGRPLTKPGKTPTAAYRVAFPGYLETMRIPVVRGRGITDADRLGTLPVVVINEYFAARHWPGEDPIGKRISLRDPARNEWMTVVGVTANAVRAEWTAEAAEEMYLPYLQSKMYLENPGAHVSYMTLVVRRACGGRGEPSASTCDPASLAPAIRRAVWSVNANIPVSDVRTMDDVVAGATAQPRFTLVLLVTFASLALVLATLGIYGVTNYAVSRRTHEIGVRIALGARSADVTRLVVGQGMVVVLAGAAFGVLGAFGLTRLMTRILYGVASTDVLTFVAAPVLLTVVAAVASWLPARRAARIAPVEALRAE